MHLTTVIAAQSVVNVNVRRPAKSVATAEVLRHSQEAEPDHQGRISPCNGKKTDYKALINLFVTQHVFKQLKPEAAAHPIANCAETPAMSPSRLRSLSHTAWVFGGR